MCCPFLVSCWESCTRDPEALYKIGMKYKDLYKKHPLYMSEKQGILVSNELEYKTYITYFNNIKYYLEAAAKKGYTEAEFEFGRWSLEECNGRYSGQYYMETAAHKGHAKAKLWLLNKVQAEKENTRKIISLTFKLFDDMVLPLAGSIIRSMRF